MNPTNDLRPLKAYQTPCMNNPCTLLARFHGSDAIDRPSDWVIALKQARRVHALAIPYLLIDVTGSFTAVWSIHAASTLRFN